MATKKKPAPKGKVKMAARPAPVRDPKKSSALAEVALLPSVNAAAVVASYARPLGLDDNDLLALFDQLAEGVKEMWAGDTKHAEAMLYGQAHALQAIFMNLARRAQRQDYLTQWDAYLRMALKAQNQCRMTLETLATIKNPPVVYARQANINNGGQQQVNNGAPPTAAPSIAPAGEPTIGQTGLLEVEAHEGTNGAHPGGFGDPLAVGGAGARRE